jgi:hypothetical protein
MTGKLPPGDVEVRSPQHSGADGPTPPVPAQPFGNANGPVGEDMRQEQKERVLDTGDLDFGVLSVWVRICSCDRSLPANDVGNARQSSALHISSNHVLSRYSSIR